MELLTKQEVSKTANCRTKACV